MLFWCSKIFKKMKTLKQYTKNIFLMSDVNIIVIMKIIFKKIFNFFCLKCIIIKLPEDI